MRLLCFLVGALVTLTIGQAGTAAGQPFCGAGGRVDVRCHGATPDDATDDTAAIQEAIDLVQPKGGTVYFPSGTYRISSTLTISWPPYPPIINLVGEGRDFTSRLVWIGPAGGTMLEITGDDVACCLPATVNGLTFDSDSNERRAGAGISLRSVNNLSAIDSTFGNVTDGIVGTNVLVSRFEGNFFTRIQRDGMRFDATVNPCNLLWIERNIFHWNGRYGIHFLSGDTSRIQDNDFAGTVPGTLAAIYLFNQHGAVLARNRFEDEPSTIDTPYRSIAVESSYTTTIASNYWVGAERVDYSISLTGANPTQVVRLLGNMWGTGARKGAVEFVHVADVIAIGEHASRHPYFGGKEQGSGRSLAMVGAFVGGADIKLLQAGDSDNQTGTAVLQLYGKQFGSLNAAVSSTVARGAWNPGDIVWNRTWEDNDSNNTLGWIKTGGASWREIGPVLSRRRREGTAPPTAGDWIVGDIFWNTNPSSGLPIGWVCVAAGTPGTWRGFGAVE